MEDKDMYDMLRSRDVPEEVIEKMKSDKVNNQCYASFFCVE